MGLYIPYDRPYMELWGCSFPMGDCLSIMGCTFPIGDHIWDQLGLNIFYGYR